MEVEFHKIQSLGSDYIVLDNRSGRYDEVISDLAFCKTMCHNNYGIGGTSVLAICSDPDEGYEIKVVDADGQPGHYCGTPIAATVLLAKQLGLFKDNYFHFKCCGRNYKTTYDPSCDRFWSQFYDVDATEFEAMDKGHFLIAGYPQYAQLVDDVATVDVLSHGRTLQKMERFSQGKGVICNYFQRSEDDNLLKARTYCHTVDAEITCGSGSVAVAVVNEYLRLKQDTDGRSVKNDENAGNLKVTGVQFSGGTVLVSFAVTPELTFTEILLGLPAQTVYRGTILYEQQ